MKEYFTLQFPQKSSAIMLGESGNTTIFLRVLIVIFSPSYLKLFKPLIMWGDTSNTQCLPHAAYFR